MLDDVVDVLMRHRANALEENAANDPNAQAPADDAQVLPNCLKRRYEVRFVPTAKHDVVKLRQVKAEHIGQLVSMKAIVTRVGDVRPLMQVVTYTCDDCGYEIYQVRPPTSPRGSDALFPRLCRRRRCSQMQRDAPTDTNHALVCVCVCVCVTGGDVRNVQPARPVPIVAL
jgi:DNA replicative helicase MCM subunit Mcm2 (Cdc46/Mcm family)